MFEQTQLSNGVTIVTRAMPGVRSAAVAVCVRSGVRDEQRHENGYAHLLEHLLFRGTERFSADQLATRFAAMGGHINAVTGRELTSFAGLVPAANAAELVGLLASMLSSPAFSDSDIEQERRILLQEFAQSDAAEAIEERIVAEIWKAHPISRPLLGERPIVEQATAAAVRSYLRENFSAERIWVVATGAVRHDEIAQSAAALDALKMQPHRKTTAPVFRGGELTLGKGRQLCHLLFALPAPAIADAETPAAALLCNILAGNQRSPLYRALREEHGLAYGVTSRLLQYSDCGALLIQTACTPGQSSSCRALLEAELARLASLGPSEEEFALAQSSLNAGVLVDDDHLESCLESMALSSIYRGACHSTAQRVQALAAVERSQTRNLLAQTWPQRFTLEWTE